MLQRKEKYPMTPARAALMQNCTVFFKEYSKFFPFWSNERLMAHTTHDRREYYAELLKKENELLLLENNDN
jgi:hypothetical protein